MSPGAGGGQVRPARSLPPLGGQQVDVLGAALDRDGARLVHLAVSLTGSLERAEALLRRALRRGSWHPGRRAGQDRPADWVHRLVVTEYLSWWWAVLGRGGELRRPVAPGVLSPAWHRTHRSLRGHRRQWVVLVLRYGQGQDDAAIGHALGCPTSVVQRTAERALARLAGAWAVSAEVALATVRGALATAPGDAERLIAARLRSQLPVDLGAGWTRRPALWLGAVTCLAVVVAVLWPRSADPGPPVPGLGTSTASLQPAPVTAAQRAALVLARYRAAVAAAAPPKLLVIGPVWEAVGAAPNAGGSPVRGLLRDEMPPIDDRAAVGTVRTPDGREATTPVLGLHQTFAELAKAVPPCPTCPPNIAVSGRLVAMTVRTPAGRAVVPGQEFTFRGSTVRLRRLAIPASSLVQITPVPGGQAFHPLVAGQVTPSVARPTAAAVPSLGPSRTTPPPAEVPRTGRQTGTATASATASGPAQPAPGRVLTLRVAGEPVPRVRGCREPQVRVIEADDAVAVAVSTAPATGRAGPAGCDPRGRSVAVTLTAPLGMRVVLDVATGRPVPVPFVRPAGSDAGGSVIQAG